MFQRLKQRSQRKRNGSSSALAPGPPLCFVLRDYPMYQIPEGYRSIVDRHVAASGTVKSFRYMVMTAGANHWTLFSIVGRSSIGVHLPVNTLLRKAACTVLRKHGLCPSAPNVSTAFSSPVPRKLSQFNPITFGHNSQRAKLPSCPTRTSA
jgi:hypothetical protein